MNLLIAVDMPEYDDNVIVSVENAENKMHARLAAYYHIYGANEQPTRDRVVELTTVLKSGGITNAKIYKDYING